jgi:signal peptidase I
VYVNGNALKEPYLTPSRNDSNNTMSKITLGEDEYFVMGDNRDNSNDSRSIGPITRSEIIGHVRFVFFPFDKIRSID